MPIYFIMKTNWCIYIIYCLHKKRAFKFYCGRSFETVRNEIVKHDTGVDFYKFMGGYYYVWFLHFR